MLPRLPLRGQWEGPASHHTAFDDDCQLCVGRVDPDEDPPTRVGFGNPGEAVDADRNQAGRETDVAEKLADPLVASPLDGHQEHANGPAGLGAQDLVVEDRVRRRKGEVALELEADHAPEVRSRHQR